MRKTIAIIAAIAALALTGGTASADSGNYSTDDGPTCYWYGSGGMYSIDCSGHSRRAQGHVSYHCELQVYGSSSSYQCRDQRGNRWSGSN